MINLIGGGLIDLRTLEVRLILRVSLITKGEGEITPKVLEAEEKCALSTQNKPRGRGQKKLRSFWNEPILPKSERKNK